MHELEEMFGYRRWSPESPCYSRLGWRSHGHCGGKLFSLMIGVTALTGFVGHLLRGHFDLLLTVVLAAAVLIGSQIGPRFAVQTDFSRLKKYFAVLLLGISVWLIYEGVR